MGNLAWTGGPHGQSVVVDVSEQPGKLLDGGPHHKWLTERDEAAYQASTSTLHSEHTAAGGPDTLEGMLQKMAQSSYTGSFQRESPSSFDEHPAHDIGRPSCADSCSSSGSPPHRADYRSSLIDHGHGAMLPHVDAPHSDSLPSLPPPRHSHEGAPAEESPAWCWDRGQAKQREDASEPASTLGRLDHLLKKGMR